MGVSCASFAYLNGATLVIALITFIASFVAMRLRMYLLKQHFNPFVVAMITAFTATLLAALAYFLNLGTNADIAVAASVLLLVPSFPIINALSDILKGYMNMGVGRWMFATMLTLSACVGIVMTLIFLEFHIGDYDGHYRDYPNNCIVMYHYCGLVFNVYIAKAIHHALHDGNNTWFWFKTSDGNFVCIWLWQHSLERWRVAFWVYILLSVMACRLKP